MSTVIIRNGSKLCAKCRDKGCCSYIFAAPNIEAEHVSDEPCACCELDFEVDDDFGS